MKKICEIPEWIAGEKNNETKEKDNTSPKLTYIVGSENKFDEYVWVRVYYLKEGKVIDEMMPILKSKINEEIKKYNPLMISIYQKEL